ncbi:hypothetical protein M3J09_008600 [Ascochyta lentis]
MFPAIFTTVPFPVTVQIWPDLRETYEAECNKGLSLAAISTKFPSLDFADCPAEWDYPPHTVAGANARAESVRRRLKEVSEVYRNIVVITHRGFIEFLVRGSRFDVCETRSYRFGRRDGREDAEAGISGEAQEGFEYGPTVLVPVGILEPGGESAVS